MNNTALIFYLNRRLIVAEDITPVDASCTLCACEGYSSLGLLDARAVVPTPINNNVKLLKISPDVFSIIVIFFSDCIGFCVGIGDNACLQQLVAVMGNKTTIMLINTFRNTRVRTD
jgi:hypothetical protein